MCFVKYYILFFCLFTFDCYALNCRMDGGPTESELKNIYTKCVKMQDGTNSTNVRGHDEQDWKEPRGHNQRYDWERGRVGNKDDRMKNSNGGGMGGNDDGSSSYDKNSSNSDKKGSNSERKGSNSEIMGSNNERNNNKIGSSSNRMGGRNDRFGNNDRMENRNDKTDNHDDKQRHDHLSDRNDFQSNEYSDMSQPQYNGYHSSTPPYRRYKRERRIENSGQRSQYNPNSQKTSSYGDANKNDEGNSSENNTSKEMDSQACAFHCFLEKLEMTGDDGMPDIYLVTHALTKDVKSEDLKDFLQESIEECFQILGNENTDEKCDFSKNLLMCLSDKGRANCDDWKDDIRL